MARTATITATRPLDATPVRVGGNVKVETYHEGAYRLTAQSYDAWVTSSVAVPGAASGHPQLRGSNVNLFSTSETPDRIARQLDALSAAGATVVRTSFPWVLLQPLDPARSSAGDVPAGYDVAALAKADAFVDMAVARGLKVLAIIHGTPCWASSAQSSLKGDCSRLGQWAVYAPTDVTTLGDAAATYARRWGRALVGIEVWNEPNHSLFFQGTAAQYAAMVRAVYTKVKAASPDIAVVGGSLALADGNYLSALYENGIKGHFDALSVHPYQIRFDDVHTGTGDPMTPWPDAYRGNGFIQGVAWLTEIMAEHGDSSPVWVTEFGYSTCATSTTMCVTRARQAEWLGDSFRAAARLTNVPVVVLHNTADTLGPDSWTEAFGLLDADLVAKPSLAAVTATWRCLGAGTC